MKRIGLILLGVVSLGAPAVEAQEWCVGGGGAYLLPLGALSSRFKPQATFALGLGQQIDERWFWGARAEVIQFADENTKKLYAKHLQMELQIYGGAVEAHYGLMAARQSVRPYLLGTVGVYRWFSTRGAYRDSSVTLPEFKEQDWSWGFGGGVGVEYVVLRALALSIDARYQLIVGELWPALAVRLENVSGFQWLSLNAGIRFHF